MVMFPFSTTCLAVSGVVSWVQYNRIRLDEASQGGVVVAGVVKVQVYRAVVALAGELVVGRH